MKKFFSQRPDGQQAHLYTIEGDGLKAQITDQGAILYSLFVPDNKGSTADVVLAYADPADNDRLGTYFGAIVGRSANRTRNAQFTLNGTAYTLDPNDNGHNSLHGGYKPYHHRLWKVVSHEANAIILELESHDGDQGFPGNATIRVTYALVAPHTLKIVYDGLCDQDTVFNMTNHSYFNLAGHDCPDRAIDQTLMMPARFFCPNDAEGIPTGEECGVEGTPMDFRTAKPISRDIGADFEPLHLQGGYDHNFEVHTNPCAVLCDPVSGRRMEVHTDLPGIQLYCGNFMENEPGKDGVVYPRRSGICLETQYFPNAINTPKWAQPVVKAHTPWHSETTYRFNW